MQSQKLFAATVRSLVFLTILLALSLPCVRGRAGVGVAAAPLAALSGTKSICPTGGDYATLTAAIAAIASQGLDGPLVLELCASYTSAAEPLPLTFPAFTGSSATNTVTVRPEIGATGLTITSSSAWDRTVELNGATYVIFDGRPGGVGSSQELTIENTNTAQYAVSFTSGASHNTLQYLILQGVCGMAGGGVVTFGGASTTGNNDNTIDHCDLRGGWYVPSYLVYSNGTPGKENSGNVLSNNHFYNFLNVGDQTAGVYLTRSTAWSITGNSFYQPAKHTAQSSSTNYGIAIYGGDGYTITNNIIGGSQPDGGGAAWTFTLLPYDAKIGVYDFIGIYLNVDATTPSTVQGNLITNFVASSASSSRVWSGIYVEGGPVDVVSNTIGAATGTGSVQVTASSASAYSYGIYLQSMTGVTVTNNIVGSISVSHAFYSIYLNVNATTPSTVQGNIIANLVISSTSSSRVWSGIYMNTYSGAVNVDSNTIGAATGTGSVQVTSSGDGAYSYGIYSQGTSDMTITNNIVGSITVSGATTSVSHSFYGIYTSNGANAFSGNTVGSLTTANSIQAATASTSATAQNVYGIYAYDTTSTSIADNTVANLTNAYVGSGLGWVIGIFTKFGLNTITGNTVRNLTSASPAAMGVVGIELSASSVGGQTVSRNVVHSLADTSAGGDIAGIYYWGPTSGVNVVDRNFIHSLNLTGGGAGFMYGILAATGVTTYQNNPGAAGY